MPGAPSLYLWKDSQMRAILLILILVGCDIRPLTDEEISASDDRCPSELYLAGICDQPPLVPTALGE
jgi:hypothetical protein